MANTETNNPTGQVPPSATGRDAGAAGLNTLADQLEAQRIPRQTMPPIDFIEEVKAPNGANYLSAGAESSFSKGWNRFKAREGSKSSPHTGWKIHISATTPQAQEALAALALKYNIDEFKFKPDIKEFQDPENYQRGKTAVFYHTELGADGKPIDWAKFVQEADDIVQKLGGPGQVVQNDKPIKGSKSAYYRNEYGIEGDVDSKGKPVDVENKKLAEYAEKNNIPKDRLYNLGDRPDPFKDIEVKPKVVTTARTTNIADSPDPLKAAAERGKVVQGKKNGEKVAILAISGTAEELAAIKAQLEQKGIGFKEKDYKGKPILQIDDADLSKVSQELPDSWHEKNPKFKPVVAEQVSKQLDAKTNDPKKANASVEEPRPVTAEEPNKPVSASQEDAKATKQAAAQKTSVKIDDAMGKQIDRLAKIMEARGDKTAADNLRAKYSPDADGGRKMLGNLKMAGFDSQIAYVEAMGDFISRIENPDKGATATERHASKAITKMAYDGLLKQPINTNTLAALVNQTTIPFYESVIGKDAGSKSGKPALEFWTSEGQQRRFTTDIEFTEIYPDAPAGTTDLPERASAPKNVTPSVEEQPPAKQVITDEMIAKEKANAIKYAQEENARRAELSKKLGIPQNSPESEAFAKKWKVSIDPIPVGISDEQARARITQRANNPDAFGDDGRPAAKSVPNDEILSEGEEKQNRARLKAEKQARLQAKTVAAAATAVTAASVAPAITDPTPTMADINLDEGKPAPKPISATPDDIADRVAWDKVEDGKGKPATKPISATPDDIADRVAWDKVEDGKGKPTTTAVSADAGTPAPSNPNARTAASTRASVANGGGGAVGIIFGAKQLSDAIETGDTFNAGLATANLGTSAAIVGAEVKAAQAGLAGAEGLAAGGASTGSKVLGAAGKYAGRAAIPLAIVSIGYDAYKEEGTGEDDKMAYKAARVGVGAAALGIGIGAVAIVGALFTGGTSLALLPVAAGVAAGGGAAVAGNYAVDKHKEGRIKDKEEAAAAEAEKENAVKREKFKEAIERLDKNKDGKVDMADLDPKGKGGISLENYANKDGVFDRKQLEEMKKDIAAIGVIADHTKDEGFVKLRDEMTKMSADADVELTKIEKAATLARLDKNKDGKIDIADFSKDGAVSIDKSRYTTAAKFDEKSTEALHKDVKLLEAAAKENAELNPALEKMKALAATAEMDVASALLDKDKNGSINKRDFLIGNIITAQEELNLEKYANSDKKIDFTALAAMKKDLAALELVANGNPDMENVRDLMKKAVADNEKSLLENEPKRLDKNNDGKLDASDFGADSKGNITRESYNGGKPLSPEALEKLRRDVDTLDALSENNSQYVKIRDSLKAIYVAETTQAGKQGQVEFDFPPDQTVNAIANGQVTPAGAAQAGSVVSPDTTSAGVAGTVVSATLGGTGDTQPNRFAAQEATTTVAQSVPSTAVGSVVSGRA